MCIRTKIQKNKNCNNMEQYKVSTYRTAGELEKALNAMIVEGYKPAFITRGVEGSITVVYEKV